MTDPVTGTAAAVEETSKAAGKMTDLLASVGFLEKRRIIKRAEGEAEAVLIGTEAEIQRAELLQRAEFVRSARGAWRQQNLETILRKTKDRLHGDVSDEPSDPDWAARFLDQCEDVSNEELQDLWAKLLSQEITTPGSCHPSTLSILATMTMTDARLFERLAGLVVAPHVNNLAIPSELLTADHSDAPASLSDALAAGALGLLQIHANLQTNIPRGCGVEYDGRIFAGRGALKLNGYPLTRAGIDLYAVVTPKFVPAVEAYFIEELHLVEGLHEPDAQRVTHIGLRATGPSQS